MVHILATHYLCRPEKIQHLCEWAPSSGYVPKHNRNQSCWFCWKWLANLLNLVLFWGWTYQHTKCQELSWQFFQTIAKNLCLDGQNIHCLLTGGCGCLCFGYVDGILADLFWDVKTPVKFVKKGEKNRGKDLAPQHNIELPAIKNVGIS